MVEFEHLLVVPHRSGVPFPDSIALSTTLTLPSLTASKTSDVANYTLIALREGGGGPQVWIV